MMPTGRRGIGGIALSLAIVLGAVASPAMAELFRATPSDYRAKLRALGPGDTLVLAPGVYRDGLPLHGLEGRPGEPITIMGDASGSGTVLMARAYANTISIKNAAYLVIRSLTLDGAGQPVDAVKAEGTSKFAHHITLEGLTIVDHGVDQQVVGISTKCPAWNWVIRDNEIWGAGTGMYLGDSDGSAPFVAGLIEGNLVVDTVGYNLQIKHQTSRPDLAGMPASPSRTVIRGNVFSKANGGSSGRLARPNVLLGHFPEDGPGRDDEYHVYGNFFHDNPHEALLQAEGNVVIHDNIFVNAHGDALHIQPHHSVPKRVTIAHNTVLARGTGISVAGGDPRFRQVVMANAVFAGRPLDGGEQIENVTVPYPKASDFLVAPFSLPGQMDVTPRSERLVRVSRGVESMPAVGRHDYYGRCRTMDFAGAVLPVMPPPWLPRLARRASDASWDAACQQPSAKGQTERRRSPATSHRRRQHSGR